MEEWWKRYRPVSLPGLLVVLGMAAEGYFYYYRFASDGLWEPISLLSSVALCLLLAVTVHLENVEPVNEKGKKRHPWAFLAVVVIVYSVVSTSAGQTMQVIDRDYRKAYALKADKIKGLEREIARLEKSQDRAEGVLDQVDSLETAFEWKNTIGKLQTTSNDSASDLTAKREELSKIMEGLEKAEYRDIYAFYVKLFTSGSALEWVKFSLHSLYSLLISLMAPVGITMIDNWSRKNSVRNEDENQSRESGNRGPRVLKQSDREDWVSVNWDEADEELGGQLRILGEQDFVELMRSRGRQYPKRWYQQVRQEAVEAGAISPDGLILIEDQADAIDAITGALK